MTSDVTSSRMSLREAMRTGGLELSGYWDGSSSWGSSHHGGGRRDPHLRLAGHHLYVVSILVAWYLTLVGVWAILYGVNEIFAAFALREAGKRAERLAG